MANSSKDKEQDKEQEPGAPKQPDEVQLMTIQPMHERRLDEVPWEGGGGRFLVGGRLVDHEGRPLNEDGSLKKDG